MRRRDFLKALAVAPVAVAVGKSVKPVSEKPTELLNIDYVAHPWAKGMDHDVSGFIEVADWDGSLRCIPYSTRIVREP